MKRLIALLIMASPLWVAAQDTAEAVVDRYLALLNYAALPDDSTLVMETTVTFHGSTDTFTLRRWFAPPTMMRVEVWHGDTLTTGFCTNGGSRHREYSRRQGWWFDAAHSSFHQKMDAYDFRGALYDWRLHGIELDYRGIVTLKGERLHVVRARQENNYTRYYFFEERSGLLVLMQEKNEDAADNEKLKQMLRVPPIEYKAYHEYKPVGGSLVPSEESFMRDGILDIMHTTMHFEARNNLIFNQD